MVKVNAENPEWLQRAAGHETTPQGPRAASPRQGRCTRPLHRSPKVAGPGQRTTQLARDRCICFERETEKEETQAASKKEDLLASMDREGSGLGCLLKRQDRSLQIGGLRSSTWLISMFMECMLTW